MPQTGISIVRQRFNRLVFRIFFPLMLIAPSKSYSKEIKETCFQIGCFNSGEKSINYLKKGRIPSNTGMCIHLKYLPEEESLYLTPSEQHLSFDSYLQVLSKFLSQNTDVLFPLFIEYNGPENWLEQEINNSELKAKVFYLPQGERWPSIEKLLENKKQVVIFTNFSTNLGSKLYNYAWDHIAEFPFTTFRKPLFEGYYTNGSIRNELLLVRDFNFDNLNNPDVPKGWFNLNENSFCIDHLLNCWLLCGKRPNFIFYPDPKYDSPFGGLLSLLNSYPNFSGSVTITGKPLERLYWQDDAKYITYGKFNFPLTVGHNLEFTPSKPGYYFSPKSVKIEDGMQEFKQINFTTYSLQLEDGLTGYYTFNKEIKNILRPSGKVKNINCEFANDIERGEVIKIPDSSFVVLDKAKEYAIVNNSFTICVYAKLVKVSNRGDYCILGTNESEYRKGLHLNIRQRKPYFGFFTNDVTSIDRIEPMKWYHIAIRYDIRKKEQSIFINGEKAGASGNHLSFIGESELILGQGINMENYLNGYLDDLCIWSRALSDQEIHSIYSGGVNIVKRKGSEYYLLITLVFLLSIIVFFILKPQIAKRQQNSTLKNIDIVTSSKHKKKNSLLLFGDFKVSALNGDDISGMFPPKIKEVLLLIILHSIRSDKGISPQKITSIVWKGFSTNTASNNRGVTFNKLRKALQNLDGINIIFEDGYWKAEYLKGFFCDYIEAVRILRRLTKSDIGLYNELFIIVQRGQFLEGIEWEWLEDFKSELTYDIVDTLMAYAHILSSAQKDKELVKVCAYLLSVDDLNELALHYHLNYLCKKGNSSKAKYTFDKFCNRYFRCYDEKYASTFQELLAKNPKSLG